jgi:hypothetical protein
VLSDDLAALKEAMDELERKFQGQQRIKEERKKTTEEQQELIALLKETIKEKEGETRKQKQTINRKEKSIKELKIFNEKLQKELIVHSSTSMDQKDRKRLQ